MKCLSVSLLIILFLGSFAVVEASDDLSTADLVQAAAERLLEIQEPDGAWPYEGVYRVNRKIPVGYRIGGSAIVCSALLKVDLGEKQDKANEAVQKSIELILDELEHPLMEPSTENRYDVRVWGHIYALELFCRIHESGRMKSIRERTDPWIPKLVAAVEFQEIKGGGWNYANQRSHAAFVTGPAVQALLRARSLGFDVNEEVLQRGGQALKDSRSENGAYQYSGKGPRPTQMPGSIARSALCETTLLMLGQGDRKHLMAAIDAFHEHWDELEKRRKKTGTHKPPYGVAPYYFYFGHRYVAQAIQLLPAERRSAEFEKFAKVLRGTCDDDHTWNDRVFDRSKAYGTAMSILALAGEEVTLPKQKSEPR